MRISRTSPTPVHPLALLMGLLAMLGESLAQLVNPLPPLADSGIEVELDGWLTIPSSWSRNPRARINHVKPCPDGVRLFCNDMRGPLWVIPDSKAKHASLFLDMEDHFERFIISPGFGTGFCSFAFHPEFATEGAPGYGKFYTGHSEATAGAPPFDFTVPLNHRVAQHGVIMEWTMDDPDDTQLSLDPPNFTKRELMRIRFPLDIHGVQELAFDPNAIPGDDNYGGLFICIGDGGSGEGQNPEAVGRIDCIMGTIARIVPVLALEQEEADYLRSVNRTYFIPKSNPFAQSADPSPGDGFLTVKEIYAYGFRNPHRISWDTGGTGKMFCGNIGAHNIEEIEIVEAGRHYGWPEREGSYLFDRDTAEELQPLPTPDTAPPGGPDVPGEFTYPAAQYDHDEGRAVVGGFVYRGSRIEDLQGMYVCGDIARGNLFVAPESDLVIRAPSDSGDAPATLQSLGVRFHNASTTLRDMIGHPRVDLRFGTDHDGELLLLSKQTGRIYRVGPVIDYNFVTNARIEHAPEQVTLRFVTEPDKSYRLWTSENLRFWVPTNQSVVGDGNEAVLVDTPSDPKRFYVIEIISP